MTVTELIEILKEMPGDKRVEIGTLTRFGGEAVRVFNYDNYVEIQSNDEK